jgi:hypothetical protein
LPAYRRRGLYKITTAEVAFTLHQSGFAFYGLIDEINTGALKSAYPGPDSVIPQDIVVFLDFEPPNSTV